MVLTDDSGSRDVFEWRECCWTEWIEQLDQL